MRLILILFLFLPRAAFAESRNLNEHPSGWTELPHDGGNVTLEPAQPKPVVTPQAEASALPELESLQGLPPEDRELLKAEMARRKAFGMMNTTNPMSDDFKLPALKDKMIEKLGFSPESAARASNSKAMMRIAAFVTSPETLADWQKVLATPIRSPWIVVELGWIIFFFVLRGWRLSRATSFGRRLFEHLWLYCAFSFGIFFLIPWLVYGKPYVRLLAGAAAALFS